MRESPVELEAHTSRGSRGPDDSHRGGLGIDIGTSGARAMIITAEGAIAGTGAAKPQGYRAPTVDR
jgi:hypothetical protein